MENRLAKSRWTNSRWFRGCALRAGPTRTVGKTGGKVVSHFTVETAGEPVALRLTPDRPALAGDGWDTLPVTVEALDLDGRPVPTANLPVEFEISGPGEIIGLGNGDPNCHEPEKGDRHSLFNVCGRSSCKASVTAKEK